MVMEWLRRRVLLGGAAGRWSWELGDLCAVSFRLHENHFGSIQRERGEEQMSVRSLNCNSITHCPCMLIGTHTHYSM